MNGRKIREKALPNHYRRSRFFQNLIYHGQRLLNTDQPVPKELVIEIECLGREIEEYRPMILQTKNDIQRVNIMDGMRDMYVGMQLILLS